MRLLIVLGLLLASSSTAPGRDDIPEWLSSMRHDLGGGANPPPPKRLSDRKPSQPATEAPKPHVKAPISAIVRATKQRVRRAERFELSVSITNDSDDEITVFNPSLIGLAGRQPVTLAVFDANRAYRGDLIPLHVGSQVSYIEAFFETLRPAGARTTKIRTRLKLPPGTYTVQAIYRDFFISEDPVGADAKLAALRQAAREFAS